MNNENNGDTKSKMNNENNGDTNRLTIGNGQKNIGMEQVKEPPGKFHFVNPNGGITDYKQLCEINLLRIQKFTDVDALLPFLNDVAFADTSHMFYYDSDEENDGDYYEKEKDYYWRQEHSKRRIKCKNRSKQNRIYYKKENRSINNKIKTNTNSIDNLNNNSTYEKAFKLTQLSTQYLLHTQEVLRERCNILEHKGQNDFDNLRKMHERYRARAAKVRRRRKESNRLDHLISSYDSALKILNPELAARLVTLENGDVDLLPPQDGDNKEIFKQWDLWLAHKRMNGWGKKPVCHKICGSQILAIDYG